MIDTASHAGAWARAIRDGRIPCTEYAPPADDRQHGEGKRVRGENNLHGSVE